MNLSELIKCYKEDKRIIEISKSIETNVNGQVNLKNTCGSLRSIIVSTVSFNSGGCHVLILPDKEEAAYSFGDLQNLQKEETILFFPSSYRSNLNKEHFDKNSVLKRTECLENIQNSNRLGNGNSCIVVTYPEALDEPVVCKTEFLEATITIDKDSNTEQDKIINELTEANFERTSFVGEPGEFSVRGGIIDVFSYSNDYPYRIEFIGSTIASIRTFDPISQESIEKQQSITIIPDLSDVNTQNPDSFQSKEPFLNFLPNHSIIWMYDQARCFESSDNSHFNNEILCRFNKIDFCKNSKFTNDLVIDFETFNQPVFNKNFDLLKKDLSEKKSKGFNNFIISENDKQIKRLFAIFEDLDSSKNEQPILPDGTSLFSPIMLSLHEGFVDKQKIL